MINYFLVRRCLLLKAWGRKRNIGAVLVLTVFSKRWLKDERNKEFPYTRLPEVIAGTGK